MNVDADNRRPIPARNHALSRRAARRMAEWGCTPNGISLFGLIVGVGSGVLLALTSVFPETAGVLWIASAGLVVLRGLSNMFDGMLAVEHGKASAGGILFNELPDRVSDVALIAGAGYSLGGSPTAGWIAACLALLIAHIRAIAVLAGAPADFRGPFAKQQRMFSIALLSCILAIAPLDWRFAWGPDGEWGPMAAWLWIAILGSALTAVLRMRRAMAAISPTTSNG